MLGAAEILATAAVVQLEPLRKALRVMLLHEEKPAKAREFLRQ